MIETTIYMRFDRYERLKRVAKEHDISESVLGELCLKKLMPILRKDYYRFSAIRYQPRSDKWKHLPFSTEPRNFEKYSCLKISYKLSFSFLVAIALDLFLDSVLFELENPDILEKNQNSYSYNEDSFFIDIFISHFEKMIIYRDKKTQKPPG